MSILPIGPLRPALQRHPVPMCCHFDQSLVVAWALPADHLAPLLPPGLGLDAYTDGQGARWGFVALALVQTRDLRPVHLPAWVGRDYFLTGYRVFVRHVDPTGRPRRGLHILRSDTDRRSMKVGGNLLTHYRYRHARIHASAVGGRYEVGIETPGAEADLHLVAHLDQGPADLPPGSPFATAQDARRYAGPLPWTFDHEPETESIIMIRGRRTQWHPQPVRVEVDQVTFLDRGPFAGTQPVLANAFHVAGVDYRWDRGIHVPIGSAA